MAIEEEKSNSELKRLAKYCKSKYWSLMNNRGIDFKFVSTTDLFSHLVYPDRGNLKTKWRGDAHSYYLRRRPPPGYGIAERVYDIACCFMPPDHPIHSGTQYSELLVKDYEDEDEYNLSWRKALLDELLAYDVIYIDVASLLHSKGYLFSFLGHLLSNNHACIRAKAADIITTMVESNPTNQKLLIDGEFLQLLLNNFNTYISDGTSRIRTLVAISALIHKNKHGMTLFGRVNGYAALRNAFISATPTSALYIKIRNLIEWFLLELDLYHLQVPCLDLAKDDSEVHKITLSSLVLLEGRKGRKSGRRLVKNHMINRSKSCLRISHVQLFPVKRKKKNNSSPKRMKKLH